MARSDMLEVNGVVEEKYPGAKFRVRLENGMYVTAHLSGKLRSNFIKIIPGDEVKVEMTPYDLTQARIIWRDK